MIEMKLLYYIMESTVDSYESGNTINKTACYYLRTNVFGDFSNGTITVDKSTENCLITLHVSIYGTYIAELTVM